MVDQKLRLIAVVIVNVGKGLEIGLELRRTGMLRPALQRSIQQPEKHR